MAFMSWAICFTRMPAPRKGGQRLIQRWRWLAFSPPPSDCRRNRPCVMTALWLRRDGESAAVDGFEDGVAAARQQGRAGFVAEFFGIGSVTGVAEEFGAVGIGDDGVEMDDDPSG